MRQKRDLYVERAVQAEHLSTSAHDAFIFHVATHSTREELTKLRDMYFDALVALAAVRHPKRAAELAAEFKLNEERITQARRELGI